MLDLLLIQPACFDVVSPNMGLGYVAESARQAGYSVELFDLNRRLLDLCRPDELEYWQNWFLPKWIEHPLYNGEIRDRFGDRIDGLIAEICSISARFYGLFISRSTNPNGLNIAREVHRLKPWAGAKVLVGGDDCQHERVAYNHFNHIPYVDHVVMGEGEVVIPKVLSGEALVAGKFIPGEPAANLDEYAWPTYLEAPPKAFAKGQMMIMGSRGCRWARCRICPDRYDGWFRARSGRNIFEEVAYHRREHGVQTFALADPMFNGDERMVAGFCEEIEKGGLGPLAFNCQMSFSHSLPESLVERLAAVGMGNVIFGLESGSQAIVDEMRKGFKIAKAEETLRLYQEHGIRTHVNIIVGFPTETPEDFEATLTFLQRNAGHLYQVEENNHFRIYTDHSDCGTNFVYENLDRYGIDPETLSEDRWVSQGGRLDLEERLRRQALVEELCASLGLGRSYKKVGVTLAD
jgi:hypothetical protein